MKNKPFVDKLFCSANLLVFYLKIWIIVTSIGDFEIHKYSGKVKLEIFSEKMKQYCYSYFSKSAETHFRILIFLSNIQWAHWM